MAKFYVRNTFTIESRSLFVLAGSVLEGGIQAGMFVNIPLNPSLTVSERIHCIEFARRSGGEDTCLCIHSVDQEMAQLWDILGIGDETIEVTADQK